ncbi:hypothetical protein ACJW31_06G038700 [Castanea mollissima]
MEEPSSASKNQVMVDGDGGEVKGGEIPRFEIKVTHEAKFNEILHKINSIEIKLCYDGVKEFIKLLKSHDPALFDSEDVQSIIECLGTEVTGLDSFIGALNRGSYSSNQMLQGWAALKQGIQNEVRTLNFVSDIFQDLKTLGASLCSKIHCPAEANLA